MSAFGTRKSLKKVTSMLTNMVDEGGVTNQGSRGVRDQRLTQKAMLISEDQEELKKNLQSQRKRGQYTIDKLLPPELLHQIPYTETHIALDHEDYPRLE